MINNRTDRAIKGTSLFSFIQLFIIMVLGIIVLAVFPDELHEYLPIVCCYLICNIACAFLPRYLGTFLPVILIRVTGLFRYVVLPLSMIIDQNIVSGIPSFGLCIEMIASYIGIFVFAYKNRTILSAKVLSPLSQDLYDEKNLHFGLGALIITVLSAVGFITQPQLLSRFIGVKVSSSVSNSGIYGLAINTLTLLLLLFSIRWIESRIKRDSVKVLLILLAGVLYINWMIGDSNNVSRWGMLIGAYLVYTLIKCYHPNNMGFVTILLFAAVLITLTIGTTSKYVVTGKEFESTRDAFEGLFTTQSLNAYFAGYKNILVGERVRTSVGSGLTRIICFVSDFFRNAPTLNRYLSSEYFRTTSLFNYAYYGSYISKDQIIPLYSQLRIYAGWFFWIPEILIVYYANVFYKKIFETRNLLIVFCYVELSFTWALVNCFNFTIMMQYVWINILPVLFVYLFDYKFNIKISTYR